MVKTMTQEWELSSRDASEAAAGHNFRYGLILGGVFVDSLHGCLYMCMCVYARMQVLCDYYGRSHKSFA